MSGVIGRETRSRRRALSPLPGGLVLLAMVLFFVAERLLVPGPTRLAVLVVAASFGALGLLLKIVWRRGAEPATARFTAAQLLTMVGLAAGVACYAFYLQVPEPEEPQLAAILLILSLLGTLVPLMVLAALEAVSLPMRKAGFVEPLRVRQTIATVVVLTFALASLAFLNFSASRKDVRFDLSYAAPNKPSASTLSLLESASQEVEILLFFERGSPVLAQIKDYFDALGAKGATIRTLDQALDYQLTEQLGVSRNGTIAYRSGHRTETWFLGRFNDEARYRIKDVDQESRDRLAKVTRDAATIYRTVGHGERQEGRMGEAGRIGAGRFEQLAKAVNGKLKSIGASSGLVNEVPADADVVLIHGPTARFLEAEVDALLAYQKRGGALMVLLDPQTDHGLEPLLEQLNLSVPGVMVANDREYVRQSHTQADRNFVFSRSFVNHRAAQSLNSTLRRAVLLFRETGTLERIEGGDSQAHVTFLARSRPNSFVDLDGDREFDEASEQRRVLNLVAAVEWPVSKGPKGRAIVAADSDVLADDMVTNEANAAFGLDALIWLLGDETASGSSGGMQDVPIRHTREEDTFWFYGSTLALPALILLFGFGFLRLRRQRGRTQ